MAECTDTNAAREITEKLDGQEEERVRQMHMATVEMRLKV